MEKNNTDGWPAIREPAGGLAEISAVRSGRGRRTIRLGDDRLADIITSGRKKILEFKVRGRPPVCVDAQALAKILKRLLKEPEKGQSAGG